MPIKLMMRWNIRAGKETEYSEFVVNEFIPRLNRLGMSDIEFWYTRYGDCQQIQASGIMPSLENMRMVLGSEEWENMLAALEDYVADYSQKLVKAARGFQL